MQLVNLGKDFKYEIEKFCRLYLPFDKFHFFSSLTELDRSKNYCIYESVESDLGVEFFVELYMNGSLEKRRDKIDCAFLKDHTAYERKLAQMLASCFEKITGYRSPWGILTGVRPAKLMGRLINEIGVEKAKDYFKNELLVSDEKRELCLDCFLSEQQIIEKSSDDSFSLYISIPFCPTRCSYCSFVSHSVDKAKKLIPDYISCLLKEIEHTAKIAKECKLKLKTVYIGGGTPTTLSAEQLTVIIKAVSDNFCLDDVLEYTVEAGRPDTITEEKLLAIKNGGATRISINPQTMNNDVLAKIGRRHSSTQTVEAFNLARKCGFDNINMDLIAGLDSDTYESFCDSLLKCLALDPENITVHSLSMKRASNLNGLGDYFDNSAGLEAHKMVEFAYVTLKNAGVFPYYMYRQSKTIGNLENVGYAKKGYEGLYNVYIMDETHTILACGASAVTKLRHPKENVIERIFNYKYPYEYISSFDTILERKQRIVEFYKNLKMF